jgi:histone demethylase JARID1
MGGGGTSSAVASETRLVSTKPPLTPPDDQQEFFGFEPGIPFQLGSFERYAKDFKDQYFRNMDDDDTSPEQCNASHNGEEQKWEPSIDMIEGEYWRIVEQATDQIEVRLSAMQRHHTDRFLGFDAGF